VWPNIPWFFKVKNKNRTEEEKRNDAKEIVFHWAN